jgi:hypothetical protein
MFPGATRRESPLRLPAHLDDYALWADPTTPELPPPLVPVVRRGGAPGASGAGEDVVAIPRGRLTPIRRSRQNRSREVALRELAKNTANLEDVAIRP